MPKEQQLGKQLDPFPDWIVRVLKRGCRRGKEWIDWREVMDDAHARRE